MPELPDVEIFKQYIDSTSLHKKITHVGVMEDAVLEVSAQTLRNHLDDEAFQKTQRIGKRMFVAMSTDEWLMLHFGMTGNLQYDQHEAASPDYSCVLFKFETGGQLAYISQRKLGSINFTKSPEEFCSEHEIGVDALDVGLEEFSQLLHDKRGMIKSALMDQSTIAGLGNVYSDEILYQSNIHPEMETNNLSDEYLKKLHQNMRRILRTAINNRAKPEEMPDHYLITHRGKDAKCPDCGGPVKRIEVSGRGCYICPNCQQKS